MDRQSTSDRLRLADIVASLSLATDLGMGQPLESALRVAVVSVRLAKRFGCRAEAQANAYYLALLLHVGCSANAHEFASWVGGDDISVRTHAVVFPTASTAEVMTGFARHIGAGRAVPDRAVLFARMLAGGRTRLRTLAALQCEAGKRLARRLCLGEDVATALGLAYERWDGAGPDGLRTDAVPLVLRLVHVAHDAQMFQRALGWGAAADTLRARAAHGLDPRVTEAALDAGPPLFEGLDGPSCWETTLDAEPSPWRTFDADDLDTLLAAFADFVDLKAPHLLGHSSGVAALAEGAAKRHGLPLSEIVALRRAALVHDLGRVGVPNGILESTARLGATEFERVRLHPYLTTRVLASSPVLAQLADLAGSHHERCDGSGYHRGLGGAQVPVGVRILAAADAYQAMTSPRPYRTALEPAEAASEMDRDVAAGRLDASAVSSVLAAAGQPAGRRGRALPAGLTEREVDVLRLASQGKTNREMARLLVVSEKTVGHHISHIYAKIGVSTRAGAALFAMEHGLVQMPPTAGGVTSRSWPSN